MTVVDDQLYWVNSDGNVLTTPVVGSPKVTQLWKLPDGVENTRASVSGTTVAAISHGNNPEYAEYELSTGQRTRGPIELPWLEPIVGSETESGKNTYSISDVARLGSQPGQ
ncbi:hypothetical protein ACFVWF_32970 [Rhodococcus qingshengii]|uniref:hypothetical protein n=1 Tax=Rhodococcus qingshengii TaxID=334542 RepID=UPI0036DB93EB